MMMPSHSRDFLGAELSLLPHAGDPESRVSPPASAPPHLEEAEGGQPAAAALLILSAEEAKPLVAISKLVWLWGEETAWSHICL